MATPKRIQILNGIKTTIDGIKKSDGYNFDLKGSSINFLDIYQIARDKFPFICLQVGPSDYSTLTQSEYTSGSGRESLDGWTIGIVGYIKINESEGTFVEITEKFHQDIINIMSLDIHLGLPEFVINTYLNMIFEPTSLAGEKESNYDAAIHLIYKIKYDFDKSTS